METPEEGTGERRSWFYLFSSPFFTHETLLAFAEDFNSKSTFTGVHYFNSLFTSGLNRLCAVLLHLCSCSGGDVVEPAAGHHALHRPS